MMMKSNLISMKIRWVSLTPSQDGTKTQNAGDDTMTYLQLYTTDIMLDLDLALMLSIIIISPV